MFGSEGQLLSDTAVLEKIRMSIRVQVFSFPLVLEDKAERASCTSLRIKVHVSGRLSPMGMVLLVFAQPTPPRHGQSHRKRAAFQRSKLQFCNSQ